MAGFGALAPNWIRPLSLSGSTGGRGAKRGEYVRENPDKTQRLPFTVDSLNPSHRRYPPAAGPLFLRGKRTFLIFLLVKTEGRGNPPAATGCSWGHFGLVKHKEMATGGLKTIGLAEKSGA